MTNWTQIRIIGCVVLIVVLFSSTAAAASATREIKKADRLYKEKKYNEALESYEKALSIRPDDPVVQYNQAVTLYRKGEFSGAEKAFLKALATGEEDLEEKTVYNAGNSKYRVGEGMEKGDIKSALKNYTEAVQYYKRAMELTPGDNDAKYNYEYTLKKIRDLEQQQQQQDQQKDEQDQKDQQQQQDQKKDQKDQQQKQQEKKEDKNKEKEQQKQDQQQKEEQEEKQQQEKEDQEKKEEQQEQEKEQQEQQEKEKEQEEKPEPAEGEMPEPAEGEMTREEAEMLLATQEEEESQMRAEQKEAKGKGRPPVLKDW
ncbi:MAG: tetratricopeptide repeat protein [Candidatus Omnitrophota bacterium]